MNRRCSMIKLLSTKMPLIWVMNKCYSFIRSIMFILVSVMGEISSGAIDIAEKNLEELITICCTKLPPSLDENENDLLYSGQQKFLNEVLKELIRQITSSNIYVRTNSIKLIKKISELQSKSVHALISQFSELLNETVAPRKHLKLRHHPIQSQIGILKGLEFCSSTQPQLFSLTLTITEHNNLFHELLPICESDDYLQMPSQTTPQSSQQQQQQQQNSKNISFKNSNDLIALRKAALNTLASFYHLLDQRESILSTLHRALANPNKEIQETAFACLKQYIPNTEGYAAALKAATSSAASPTTTPSPSPAPSPSPSTQPGQPRQTMQIAADYLREYLHPLTEYTSLNLNVMQHLSYITQIYPTILNEKFSEYLLAHLRHWLDDIVEMAKKNASTLAAIGSTVPQLSQPQLKSFQNELKLCSAIISLLAELQSAPAKLVDMSISILLNYERAFMLEVNGIFRLPLSKFLRRYPFETLKFLLNSERIKDFYLYRFLLYLIKTQPAFANIFKNEPHRLIQMLNESYTKMSNGQQLIKNNQDTTSTTNGYDLIARSNQIQYLTILIVYRLVKQDSDMSWIVKRKDLIDCLLKIWCDEKFHEKHKNIDQLDYIYWKEPVYLIKIFLRYHESQMELNYPPQQTQQQPHQPQQHLNHSIELLFKLLIVFQHKALIHYEFLRLHFNDIVAKTYSCQWKRDAFFTFVKIFNSSESSSSEMGALSENTPNQNDSTDNTTTATIPPTNFIYSQRLKANILQYILIPCFQYCFENNQHCELIGGPPQPDIDSDTDIISVFINKVIHLDSDGQQQTAGGGGSTVTPPSPGQPTTSSSTTTTTTVVSSQPQSDAVRIFLLQLSSLFVQYAHDYIHDVNNKKQGTKLRRLMTFAWPCLLAKNCVDPFNKYHGQLLLSHIISKFAIHKRIFLQVYHSLLKAHAPEAKIVVRQALEILTPSFPTRIEDGYLTLATWTKKILVEDSHSVSQLAHMLYIIVKYHRVYYLIRHPLINPMIGAFQKVGSFNTLNSTPENRQLAIDLTQVILRWEAQCVRESQIYHSDPNCPNIDQAEKAQLEQLLLKHNDMLKPFDKHIAECILNLFIRIACPLNELSNQQVHNQQQQQQQQQQHIMNEILAKRCLGLFQTAISNDIWPNAEIKFDVIDKILLKIETTPPAAAAAVAAATSTTTPTATPSAATAELNQNQKYTSICTCIEIITFLIENIAKTGKNELSKIQFIFHSIQRGMTACLMNLNSQTAKPLSKLIQKIMKILPIECFNVNPTVTAPNGINLSTSPSASLSHQQQQPQQQQEQIDSIYYLFGQPEGILCKTIIESLTLYEKTPSASSTSISNLSSGTTSTTTTTSSMLNDPSTNNSAEILTNCLLLLKSASTNNPQYIDRIMGSFMKILQKLYRDHLNSTGVLSSPQSAAASNFNNNLLSATSTTQKDSNIMIINSATGQITVNAWSELLIQCLELIKYRVGVMSVEMRKVFINSILVTLIDRSIDLRLIRYLLQVIADWIHYKSGPLLNQIPSMKEKLILLQRLSAAVEKRFTQSTSTSTNSDQLQHLVDIQESFLEIIAFVYNDEAYTQNNDFKSKLETSFLTGLKSQNPKIRQTFFQIFNKNFHSSDLYERLCYIIVTQNWAALGDHYWIKQCIQLTLGACAHADTPIEYSDIAASRFHFTNLLPNQLQSEKINENRKSKETIMLDVNVLLDDTIWPDSNQKNKTFNLITNYTLFDSQKFGEQKMDIDDVNVDDSSLETKRIDNILANQFNFFDFCDSINKNGELIVSMCQLCHSTDNDDLAHQIWIQLFIQMFNLLTLKQQQNLYGELTPFVSSGSHCIQKRKSLSTLNTFLESFALAKPVSLFLRPYLLAYLAKNHNLWHRVILLLESSLLTSNDIYNQKSNGLDNSIHNSITPLQNDQHETFSSLCQLYSLMKESDYRCGLWFTKAVNDNTKIAMSYQQQGLFYQAQKMYEDQFKLSDKISTNSDQLLELNLWEERWISCCKELNQWNELSKYAEESTDVLLKLECKIKQCQPVTPKSTTLGGGLSADWSDVRSILLSNSKEANTNLNSNQKDINSYDESWRWFLYQGYFLVCNQDECHNMMLLTGNSINYTGSASSAIESKVEKCIQVVLKEWRHLPKLVSPAHMVLLQGAQLVVELQEAFQIQNNLQLLNQLVNHQTSVNDLQQPPLPPPPPVNPTSVLQEIKAIIKTWRTRLPLINDDLSYWNDIFTWRQYHYESFTRFYEKQQALGNTYITGTGGANPAMLGVHALAQGIVHFGKIARKQHLYDLCLGTLNKIHKKQSVPIIDCFLKVKQEIKCYSNTIQYLTPNQAHDLLEVIEATNLHYFTKENIAELMSLKANFVQLCGNIDDANHLYSYSTELNDNNPKLWGAWGDFITNFYVSIQSNQKQQAKHSIEAAESAMHALLQAARHPNSECKVRKYIAKILWLLTYDNEKRVLHQAFDLYAHLIPASNWINWIPQLITLITRNDDTGKYMITLMNQIVRVYPLALYYPLRTLYLKLKSEEAAEKLRLHIQMKQQQQKQQQQQQQQQNSSDVEMKADSTSQPPPPPPQPPQTTATESLIRVTTLMHRQRELHPTLFNILEGLIDQLLWLKVNW
jgi:transformation/transcription domain-associated protein